MPPSLPFDLFGMYSGSNPFAGNNLNTLALYDPYSPFNIYGSNLGLGSIPFDPFLPGLPQFSLSQFRSGPEGILGGISTFIQNILSGGSTQAAQGMGLIGLRDQKGNLRSITPPQVVTESSTPIVQSAANGGAVHPADLNRSVLPPFLQQWVDLINEVSGTTGVPANVLAAIVDIESGGDPKARSAAGALGLAQVMPFHFRPGENPFDPRTNLMVAAQRVLKPAYDRYGTWTSAAAAYFGAVDPKTGQPTGARDATGASGHDYVRMFADLATKYGMVPATESGTYQFPIPHYTGQVNLHHGQERGGTDLFAPRGTPVLAVSGGQVIDAGYSPVGGYNVTIRGDDGRLYYYAHLDAPPLVQAGQRILAGTQLGAVGNTGNAANTPPHLHLGIGPSIISGVGPAGGTGAGFDAVSFLRGLLSR